MTCFLFVALISQIQDSCSSGVYASATTTTVPQTFCFWLSVSACIRDRILKVC